MKHRFLQMLEPPLALGDRRKIFSDTDLMRMIVPLFFEQLLTMMVGIADTFMISYAGDAAVSGVSLVNMFVTLMTILFSLRSAPLFSTFCAILWQLLRGTIFETMM